MIKNLLIELFNLFIPPKKENDIPCNTDLIIFSTVFVMVVIVSILFFFFK